jgi:hypothetical protein
LNILNRYSESRTDSKAISIEDLYDFFKATHSFDEIDECGENKNAVQHSGKNPESKTKLKSFT